MNVYKICKKLTSQIAIHMVFVGFDTETCFENKSGQMRIEIPHQVHV